MTQQDVERKSTLSQPMISRLESPTGSLPAWETVMRYVTACDGHMLVGFGAHAFDEQAFRRVAQEQIARDDRRRRRLMTRVAAVRPTRAGGSTSPHSPASPSSPSRSGRSISARRSCRRFAAHCRQSQRPSRTASSPSCKTSATATSPTGADRRNLPDRRVSLATWQRALASVCAGRGVGAASVLPRDDGKQLAGRAKTCQNHRRFCPRVLSLLIPS